MSIYEILKGRRLFSTKLLCLLFRNIFWFGAVFSYYFQFPYVDLSAFIVPCFAGYFLFSSKAFFTGIDKKFFFLWIFWATFLTFNLWSSIAFFDAKDNAWRFYFILLVIPLCFFLRNSLFSIEYWIFKYLSIFKAFFLIVMALYMVYVGDYVPFRIWANALHGDMYFVYDFFPRIQLQGNALLLVALFFEYVKKRTVSVSVSLFFLGILIEGNFSFYLSLLCFFGYYMFRDIQWRSFTIKKILGIFCCFLVFIAFFFYSIAQKKQKEAGGNAVRVAQAEILTSGDPLLGNGLGAKVFDNVYLGVEADAKYFELQTLYIYYQIGLIGMILFYMLNIMALRFYKSREICWIYLSYLLGAFFNPYCFDVTHMIVVTICGNFVMFIKKTEDKEL